MSRFVRHALGGAMLILAANLPSLAQPNPALLLAPDVDKTDKTARSTENGAVEEAPQKTEATIIASKDKSTAKLSFARVLSGGHRLSASLATPVNKNDDATQFFTLDGPAEDVEVSVAWKKQSFNLALLQSVDFNALVQQRLDTCNKLNVTPCDDTQLEEALKKSKATPMATAAALRDFHLVRLQGRKNALPLFRAIPFHFYGVTGSLGRTERKFFDLSAAEKDDDRRSYSLDFTYGRIFRSSRWTVSLATQRKYEEGKKAQVCTAVEGSTTLEQCKELPLKEAAEVDSVPLTLEYRLWFQRKAISPKIVYDFEREVFAGSLPVYLFPDADQRPAGGIRLDWEEGKDLSVSVFVSPPLGLD